LHLEPQKQKEVERSRKKLKDLDLIALLLMLCCVMVFSAVVSADYLGNQAEGSDVDIYIDYGGLAFQDGHNPSGFIALYTPVGALNTSDNDFYVGPQGGGMFTFLSNETFTLQFLSSFSANIEGDQGNGVRGITHDADGLSGLYPVDAGDRVTIYWMPMVDYPMALPLISFWGMVGSTLVCFISSGAAIKKRKFQILWIAIISGIAAFIFYLVFTSL
jgi:hypothetical protein